MKKLFLSIAALAFFGAACSAEPGVAASWSHLTIQTPPGYRLAASALLPGARIIERSRLESLAGDSTLPDLVALFEPPGGSGYYDRGVWLLDRVHLIRRVGLDGGTGDGDSDVGSVAAAWDGRVRDGAGQARLGQTRLGQTRLGATESLRSWLIGAVFDEGTPRFAVSLSVAARLGESHPLLVELAGHGRRALGDASIEDLLQGRLEAALVDGAEAAAFHRREHPLRDLLEETPLDDGVRELHLYATRNRMDLGGAVDILLKGRTALLGLGYDPAR